LESMTSTISKRNPSWALGSMTSPVVVNGSMKMRASGME